MDADTLAPVAKAKLCLAQVPEADALLSKDPLALLVGFVLDQQIPLEWAFRGPFELTQRLGTELDAAALASMDPDKLAAVFAARPSLHRYPASMAKRVQALCEVIVEQFGGKADAVWRRPKTGKELLTNVRLLPGFGDQKARIFIALLGKQLGVQPAGWQEACAPYGEPGTLRSVADIVSRETLEEVRTAKKAVKAAAKAAAAKA
jgi:uncharacterized HhH-GPD family protein